METTQIINSINNTTLIEDHFKIECMSLPIDTIKIILSFMEIDWETRDNLKLVSKDIKNLVDVKCDREVIIKMKKIVNEKLIIKLEKTSEYLFPSPHYNNILVGILNPFGTPSQYSFKQFMHDLIPTYGEHGHYLRAPTPLSSYRFVNTSNEQNVTENKNEISDILPADDYFDKEYKTVKFMWKFHIDFIENNAFVVKKYDHKALGYSLVHFGNPNKTEDYLLTKANNILCKHWQK